MKPFFVSVNPYQSFDSFYGKNISKAQSFHLILHVIRTYLIFVLHFNPPCSFNALFFCMRLIVLLPFFAFYNFLNVERKLYISLKFMCFFIKEFLLI